MSVIEYAENRLQEEIRQNDLGANNDHLIVYWSAYRDGANAQLKEDLKAMLKYEEDRNGQKAD